MDMLNITKITLCFELFEQGVPQSHIAKQLDIDRVTVYRWLTGIEKAGELELFLDQYISSKKGSRLKRKVDGLLKSRIYRLREENNDCCGQKIRYFLNEEYKQDLGVTSIYKILSEKYKLRSKWKKNQKRGNVTQSTKPREIIQMDSVHFGTVYAFTSVDTFTRDVVVKLYPTLTSIDGLDFLNHAFKSKYGHTELLQTDGGPEFKGEFRRNVFTYADRFRVARPYKKNEQSYIESFNRSLRKECLGWGQLKPQDIPTLTKELEQYLLYYHEKRPHIGLGMKPPNKVTTVAY
jgi:transposase